MLKAPNLIVESTYAGVPGVTRYRQTGDDGEPIEGPTVAVVGMVHGNEPVGGQLLKLLAERVGGLLLRGEIITVRANLAAEASGIRHMPMGEDLNRLWDGASIERIKALKPEGRRSEESRVLELAPVIAGADVILDFHSTTRPTHPFLVFRDDQRHVLLGQILGVERMVTGLHKGELLGGGMCPDVGLYPHQNTTRLGFTYEAGQHQDPTNLSRAYQVLIRLLFAYGMWDEQPELLPQNFSHQIYEVMDRFRQVSSNSDQWRFVGYKGGEGGGSRVGPPRTLASFEAVEPGEIVMRRGRRVISRAHSGFTMLLPNPNATAYTDLYYLAQRRLGGIVDGEHIRTNETALQEAGAVESMLDTLDDDAFDRGMTLASFDSRQVLDQCADLAARTLRLPAGHPNRKVTVLGRGDWGTGEAARRVGRRYRAVMRSLLKTGVPIDRYQVLRGASLGWLNALTSASMSALLAEGHDNSPQAEPSRLFLSNRQPHTLSLLVVGDIDRALELGDIRGVRVALLVEASTAIPNGEKVKVRVARMALFSSRPELLRMVSNLLASFREQHEALGRQAYLNGDETLQESKRWQAPIALYDTDGNREAVRRKVIELQIESWRKRLSNKEDLGSFSHGKGAVLAMQMAQTGILDSETLSLMLKEEPDGSAVFDLNELDRAAELAMIEVPPSRRKNEFHEPVAASEVDADSLQRWLGWKRNIRNAQVIPGTRGYDVDLAFDEDRVCGVLARWFVDAKKLASEAGKRVMVVAATDGNVPSKGERNSATKLTRAHRALLMDDRVRYLRIQHAQGIRSQMIRSLLEAAHRRPAGGNPISFGWEMQHGVSLSVFVVATCSEDDTSFEGTGLLDKWEFQRCAVVVSTGESSDGDEQLLGLFTEPLKGVGGGLNQELLHFGRRHCEGLLKSARYLVHGRGGSDIEHSIVRSGEAIFASWIRQLRAVVHEKPWSEPITSQLVVELLGLRDPELAEQLIRAVNSDTTAEDGAKGIWASFGTFDRA